MSCSSIHVVVLRNRLYLGRNVVTSFFMHFENIGRGLLREGKLGEREWAVCSKQGGMNKKKSLHYCLRLIPYRSQPAKRAILIRSSIRSILLALDIGDAQWGQIQSFMHLL